MSTSSGFPGFVEDAHMFGSELLGVFWWAYHRVSSLRDTHVRPRLVCGDVPACHLLVHVLRAVLR